MQKQLNSDQLTLVMENVEMAKQLAWQFGGVILKDNYEKCITMDDLEQDATEGLIEAAMRFADILKVEFRTFAYIWIRKYVLRSVRKFSSPLSVSNNYNEGVVVVRFDALLSDVAGSYATDEDDGSPSDLLFYRVAEEEATEQRAEETIHERIEQALSGLKPKERKTLECLFPLEGEALSGVETAKAIGVTPTRVTQIKEQALRKMAA